MLFVHQTVLPKDRSVSVVLTLSLISDIPPCICCKSLVVQSTRTAYYRIEVGTLLLTTINHLFLQAGYTIFIFIVLFSIGLWFPIPQIHRKKVHVVAHIDNYRYKLLGLWYICHFDPLSQRKQKELFGFNILLCIYVLCQTKLFFFQLH